MSKVSLLCETYSLVWSQRASKAHQRVWENTLNWLASHSVRGEKHTRRVLIPTFMCNLVLWVKFAAEKLNTHDSACFSPILFALSKYSSITQHVSVVCRLNRSCWLLVLSFTLGGALLRVHYRHEDRVWWHVLLLRPGVFVYCWIIFL